MTQKGTPVVGQACTVTKGDNKGEKGTYTRDDEGNIWCEGEWGGTECGTDRCDSAKADARVFEYTAPDGKLVQEVKGLVESVDGGTFDYTVVLDADSGRPREVHVLPLAAVPLAELGKSDSEAERRAAAALEAEIGGEDGYGKRA